MNNQLENSIKIGDINHDLASIEQLAWKKLVNGSVKKKNGFRTICIGTISATNDAALRVVINR